MSCTAAVGPQQGQRGSSLARTALAEYAEGEADGSYHHHDPKYWEFAGDGTAYVDGSETPWCASFVSWCVAQNPSLSGIFPEPTASVASYVHYFEANVECGSVYDVEEALAPREGDLICFGRDSGAECTDHIGIVVEVDSDGWGFTTVEGNTGYGLGGDGALVYKHHYTAGKGYDLGSYWSYAKLIRPNYPQGAFGSIEIPETVDVDGTAVRVGTFASYECDIWDSAVDGWVTEPGQNPWTMFSIWAAHGSKYDEQGFATIDGRYMIACTAKFGEWGDEVVFYFDDGRSISCIVTDQKDETDAHGTPALEWGHREGDEIGVLEFFGKPEAGPSCYYTISVDGRNLAGCRVTSAENLGPYAGL